MAHTPSESRSVPVFVIPALDAEATIAGVVRELVNLGPARVIVVDDGSRDATGQSAREAGAHVIRHPENLGKGLALRTGLSAAGNVGARAAVSLDADGQHSARDAWFLARHPAPDDTLILGIRDMRQAGAPRANQLSNRFSNWVLSGFSGVSLRDTQCGLRRYPIALTLNAGANSAGFAFESELLLIAGLHGWHIEQLPVGVTYPPAEQRMSHFHNVRDPAKIVVSVVSTVMRDKFRRHLGGGR